MSSTTVHDSDLRFLSLEEEVNALDADVMEMLQVRTEVLTAWSRLKERAEAVDVSSASPEEVTGLVNMYDSFIALLGRVYQNGRAAYAHKNGQAPQWYGTFPGRLDKISERAQSERDTLVARRRFVPSSSPTSTPVPPTEPIAA